MRRGGEALRERMASVERHLEHVTAEAGEPLASHANATVVAGGKRLRPLLVVLAAEVRRRASGRAGRRGAPRAGGRGGRARALRHARARRRDRRRPAAPRPPHGGRRGRAQARGRDRRPAVLAGLRRARAQRGRRPSCRPSRTPARRSPKASCCSARTPTPRDVAVERYLRRCELKTAALFEAACRLGALYGRRGLARAGRRAGRVRAAHRPRLPAARRRARRVRSGRADRQGARHRPARRHRHAALDPRPRARARAGARSTSRAFADPEQAEELCERIAATGALEEARERALAVVAEAKAALAGSLPDGRAVLLDLVADAVVERYR